MLEADGEVIGVGRFAPNAVHPRRRYGTTARRRCCGYNDNPLSLRPRREEVDAVHLVGIPNGITAALRDVP